MSLLDSLRQFTIVVADTGDIEAIKIAKPTDATTNPSLLLKAAKQPQYRSLVEEALHYAARQSGDETSRTMAFMDKLFVNFGCEILRFIDGRVSTELDAMFSFDVSGSLAKARSLIKLYEAAGVDRQRVLIKLGATWEGICAARQLELEGIHTNLTLLFSFAQAVACAEAKVTVVSPFVGRIYDWFKQANGAADIPREEDPGVSSVVRIYNYYKLHGYETQVMGASFRKVEQVIDLAGCDLLTIGPELIAELAARDGEVRPVLTVERARSSNAPRLHLDEKTFRFQHNEDQMAVEKLSEGIRNFNSDARKLEHYAREGALGHWR